MAVPILKEPPITSRDAFIPYAMTGLNMLAPTIAAHSILAPHVFLVSIFLILLGVPCSVYFRQRGYNRIVLNLATTIPLLVLTWLLVRSLPGLQIDWSNPMGSIIGSESMDQLDGMLHIFTVLAAGRAILLVTSADLLQTPLPGISIFLLAVITHHELDRNPLTILCLIVLFITSAYLFSHEQHQQWFSIHTPPRIQRQLLLWTLIFALVISPLVLIVGNALQPFNMMAVTTRMARRNRLFPNLLGRGGQLSIFLDPTLEVGGARWPNGKQPVMNVTVDKDAPQGLLWRGATYETYEDGSWQSAQLSGADRLTDSGVLVKRDQGWTLTSIGAGQKVLDILPEPIGDPGIKEAIAENKTSLDKFIIHQTFDIITIAHGSGSLPFFGAYQAQQVQGSEMLFRVDPKVAIDGSILLRSSLWDQYSYHVVSIIKPLPTSMPLNRTLPYEGNKQTFVRHFKPYLQMPSNPAVRKRIREKAIEILGKRDINLNTAKDFDIIHEIELELNNDYRYTLKPAPPPKGVDPIVDFLDRQKVGYCNYFSGSMVLLCRSVGIPARFVVGFATGDMDETYHDDQNNIRYKVNASHAHSWVEVYLKGYGWYTVDPTAGSRLAPTVWGTTWDILTTITDAIKGWIHSWSTAIRTSVAVRVTSLCVLALLLALGVTLFIALRDRPPEYPRKELTEEEARQSVLACYQRMHRWLERWGVHKPEGCTATEFEALFSEINPAMGGPVRVLTDLYIRQQYGGGALDDAAARQAINQLHELWAVAKTERKRLYAKTETEV